MHEPQPADPCWPRYSDRPFPPYRYVPGRAPHPRRHPAGHSFGRSDPLPQSISHESWNDCNLYLYGVDLYNFAYWWEAHEAFESLWHLVGRHTTNGQFFQGLIQLSAAHLKDFMGAQDASQKLVGRGLAKLQSLPSHYMGLAIPPFTQTVQQYFDGSTRHPPLIELQGFPPHPANQEPPPPMVRDDT